MRRALCATVLVFGVGLAGCAAMSQRECQLGDWHTAGFDDGVRGASMTRVADYRKACSKYNISPDLAAYRAGYDLGLETYCRDSNGFAVGARGAAYEGVCPTALEGQFLNGFRPGHHLYELQSAVSGIDGQIAQRKYSLRETEEQLTAATAAVVSDSTPSDQRAALLVKIAELSRRHGALEAQLSELERSLGTQQEELRRFRESLAYNQ